MHVSRGFTIVELMTALAVVAILSAASAPAMDNLLKDLRLKSETMAMVESMYFARTEAVKRKVPVLMCRSADPQATNPTCGGATQTWTGGWLVFASGDGNDTYDNGSDTLLRTAPGAPTNVTIKANTAADQVLGFDPDGTTYGGIATARFALCDDRGGASGREVSVLPYGRPRTVEGDAGTPVNCEMI